MNAVIAMGLLWDLAAITSIQYPIVHAIGSSALAVQTDSASPGQVSNTSIEDLIGEARGALDRLETEQDPTERAKLIDQVKKHVGTLQTTDERNPWALYLAGRLNALIGRRGDARDQLRKFLETRDGRNEWSAYLALGDLFVDEFPRLAKFNYDKAAELKPNEPAILVGISVCYFKLAELEKARQLAQEAVAADGRKSERYLSQLATVLAAQKQWSAAGTEATAALTIAQSELNERPGSLEAAQALDGALQLLVEIAQGQVRESANDPAGYLRLADYLKRKAGISLLLFTHERLAILTQGIQNTAPNTPLELRLAYAEALAEAGRIPEAIQQYDIVITTDSRNTVAQESLARLRGENLKAGGVNP